MASSASARTALLALFTAGLLLIVLAHMAGAAAAPLEEPQQVAAAAAARFRVRLGEAMAAPLAVPVGTAASAVEAGGADPCNLVPQTCTPAGWVPGKPFPMHPKDEACCKVIREQGISCLCKLWKVWNVPKEVVKSYRKDCKLSDKLSC